MAGTPPLVTVEGARRLRATLRRAGEDFKDLKDAHAKAAAIAAEASAALAPVREGKLRETIRSSGTKTAGIIRAGYASVPYAPPIHWGWPARSITAQPFLSDGARDSEGRWLPVYMRTVDGIINRVEGL